MDLSAKVACCCTLFVDESGQHLLFPNTKQDRLGRGRECDASVVKQRTRVSP